MFRLKILLSLLGQSFLIPMWVSLGMGIAFLMSLGAPAHTASHLVMVPVLVSPTPAPTLCPLVCGDFSIDELLAAVTTPTTAPTVAPTIAPTPAPLSVTWPVNGVITQYFGGGHAGLDIAAPIGSTVVAAVSGTVQLAGWYDAYGIAVISSSVDKSATYGHLSEVFVSPGEQLTVGQPIGLVGMTGATDGPHLHFELRAGGALIDPLGVLP